MENMQKIRVIAKCLVNSNMVRRLEDAEHTVRRIYELEFPNSSFNVWNSEIDDRTAKTIIRNVGRASQINVAKFIEDLSPPP